MESWKLFSDIEPPEDKEHLGSALLGISSAFVGSSSNCWKTMLLLKKKEQDQAEDIASPKEEEERKRKRTQLVDPSPPQNFETYCKQNKVNVCCWCFHAFFTFLLNCIYLRPNPQISH
ncbi:hypothetical protein SLEP1_g41315 [Rubroshorea leprosula]|uniref:Uncharacterized protein n=1 Tax=Rubroshorea leprosula TaxID=152421 RepID=A0AAV5L6M9_9ROSI|nr:hypothetical protein SLEP1_g41315 [Rubroshorea leprosula]